MLVIVERDLPSDGLEGWLHFMTKSLIFGNESSDLAVLNEFVVSKQKKWNEKR